MSRMYYDLGGKGGVKGWQYMFIICGVISAFLLSLLALPSVRQLNDTDEQ